MLLGSLVVLVLIIGAFTVGRHSRGDDLWKPDDLIPLAIFVVNLAVLMGSSGQWLDRANVRPLRSSARPWSEVRRVFVKRDHLVFDFGKPCWDRPWLILPKDPYELARVRLLLDRSVPRERMIAQER